jgi:UDP-galactopyranose mutase
VPAPRILIIGAGPCGLACGRELDRLGHRNWRILEQSEHAGGLASSVVDSAGFTWDLGGHVVFSHFGEFDALMSEVMNGDVDHHDRSSYIRFADRWIPYPFQNHLRHLPVEVQDECLRELERAPGASAGMDFAQWMVGVFGGGITRHFMRPYNWKVWATPPSMMSADWIAERVSVIDYARAARNVREDRDDLAWGPNNTFVFPTVGGTGEIYRRIAARYLDRISFGTEVVAVDPESARVRLDDGQEHSYDALVSTMPLDRLIKATSDCPDAVRDAASRLRHNGVYMVGVGFEAPLSDTRSWMYFPQPDVEFYRVTNFAKYAAANVPGGDTSRYCSYMTETAYSEQKRVTREGLEARVAADLVTAGVVANRPPVASVHVEDIEYAYPVPTLSRDRELAAVQPWLMERRILSRGRFGSWRYEMGNMDHAVKMGADAARFLVGDTAEELWRLDAPLAVP